MDQQIPNDLVRCTESFFDSSLQGHRIHTMKWELASQPDRFPRAIVQIIHGMEEHIARYDDFARFLARRGFVVYGSSHIGHGKSAPSQEAISCLPENGAQVMVSDVHTLRMMAVAENPEGLPYFMFGHSMGSFVLRSYLARYGRGLAGAVICGTGQQPQAASRFAAWLSRSIGRRKGFDYRSSLIDGLAVGSYSKAIPNARTKLDWLSVDPKVVDAYIADPACGVMFSVGGYASLTDLTAEVASDACAGSVPDGLPVLFIAGQQDPVGDMGKGVKAAADAMERCSKAKVSVVMYEGMRHEILNEPEKMLVYADVADFFDRALEREVR